VATNLGLPAADRPKCFEKAFKKRFERRLRERHRLVHAHERPSLTSRVIDFAVAAKETDKDLLAETMVDLLYKIAQMLPGEATEDPQELLRTHRIAQAQELLKLGIRRCDDHFVCSHADGRMMQPTWITHEWVRLIRGTALPICRFDDLRHAHATHLLASGAHPKVASERLGHTKVGITLDLYGHVMPGMQEVAAARADAALQDAMKKR
jgi:hypothetical protein